MCPFDKSAIIVETCFFNFNKTSDRGCNPCGRLGNRLPETKITLVTMTYHSQRPHCASLSPHVSFIHSTYLHGIIFVTPSGNILKSHFKAQGLYNFIRGFGWVINGRAYKQGGGLYPNVLISRKKNVSERRDKTYLRNELKHTSTFLVTSIIHLLCVTING